MKEAKKIIPNQLTGPRSFFTDLDPNDPDYCEGDIARKLKLQLLTKNHIVIAASSLFHGVGHKLFSQNPGLTKFLDNEDIVPAIRDQFSGPKDFFAHRKEYSQESADFFCSHTTSFLSWNLQENSQWFTNKFLDGVRDDMSLLRQKTDITSEAATTFVQNLEEDISQSDTDHFLRREQIEKHATLFNSEQQDLIRHYANLVYRLSGTRVVNCEGHFPQSNLTRLGIAGNEQQASDDAIFWDIYVEAVVSFLNSATKITPERLDRLSFEDIRTLRTRLAIQEFANTYDRLIAKAKQSVSIEDPDRLILTQQEIAEAARQLQSQFKMRVKSEIGEPDSKEKCLWEVANVLALVASPVVGMIVGCASALKSLPEITALFSKPLSEALDERLLWFGRFVNSKVGWTKANRNSLLETYKELVGYGLQS